MKLAARIAVGALALALAAGAGAYAFRRDLGDVAFARAAQHTVGRDRAAELPDGLHIYLCGTGGPMPDAARAGPCLGVLAGQRAFVFDIGSGGMRRLGRMGFPMARLERVYLTHLHSDHFDGLGELMLQAWVGGGRHAPLSVAGPEGVAEVVAGFNQAYRIDSGFRTAHHGADVADPAGYGAVAETLTIPPEGAVVFREGEITITAIPALHAPASPAFSFRIDYRGRSVAISGDTASNPRFARLSEGVDVMLHEALSREQVSVMERAARARAQPGLAKILFDIPGYHTTPMEAARLAHEARARTLFLYHLVPSPRARFFNAAFLADAPQLYDGPIRIGEDGMLITLAAGEDAVRVTNALR